MEALGRAATWLVVGVTAGLGLGAGVAIVSAAGDRVPLALLNAAVGVGAGWTCVGVALGSRGVVPGRVRTLLACLGIAWLLSAATYADSTPLSGALLGNVWVAVLAHLALALPDGEVRGAHRRVTVALAYLLTTPTAVAVLAAQGTRAETVVGWASAAVKPVVGIALVAILARSLTTPGRSGAGSAPLLMAAAVSLGALSIVGVVAPLTLGPLTPQPEPWVDVAVGVVICLVPLGVVTIAARRSLRRASLMDITVRIEAAEPGELRLVLAQALGDPDLGLAFHRESGTWVDESGEPVGPPGEGAIPVLVADGRTVAVLSTGASAGHDPVVLRSAVAGARLALANAALRADLAARLAEVERSRERIVLAVDAERRRIERALHDGVQVHLLSALLTLGTADHDSRTRSPVAEASTAVRGALDEVRRLARGVHPAVLQAQGLTAALDGLLESWPAPVSSAVEVSADVPAPVAAAAYYVAAEALTNAAKHAPLARVRLSALVRGGRLVLEIRDDGPGGARPVPGGGLEGLGDRCAALGGLLSVDSPTGVGTLVRADLPCAS